MELNNKRIIAEYDKHYDEALLGTCRTVQLDDAEVYWVFTPAVDDPYSLMGHQIEVVDNEIRKTPIKSISFTTSKSSYRHVIYITKKTCR